MNLCPGKSVGAIIKNAEGKYLCLYRLKHPVGLAFVAGHIDPEDEGPSYALVREVREESDLKMVRCKLILHRVFPNTCKASPNCNGHEWFVYNIDWYEGEAKLMEPDKHKFVKWLSVEEIYDYVLRKDYDPAWFEMILPMIALMK